MGRLHKILLVLFLTAYGCGNKQADTALVKAADFMDHHPDSALSILKNFTVSDFSSSASRARFSLLYSQALDKNYIDIASDSIILPAVRYYEKKGSFADKARSYYYLARVWQNAGEKDTTIKYLIKAKDHVQHTADHYLEGLICQCMGVLYSEQYSFRDALALQKQAAAAYAAAGIKENECDSYIGIGRNYYLQKMNDSARFYYGKAREIAYQTNNRTKIFSLLRQEAVLLADEEKTDSCKAILKEAYRFYNGGNIPAEDYPLWSSVYFKENKLDSARRYALLAYKKLTGLSLKRKAGLLALLENIETKSRNLSQALKYNKKFIILTDSINQAEKKTLIQQAEQKYKNESLKATYAQMRTQHRSMMLLIGLAILAGVLLTWVIIIRLVKARKRAIEEKNRELESQKEFIATLNENFADMKSQYERLLENFNKEDEREAHFFHAFESRMAGLKELMDQAYTSENNTVAFYQSFKKYINDFNQKEHSFYDLQYIVNKKYNGIIDYLKEHYPDLTKSDLDLFSMICFGFSLNSIRFIYNHNNIESLYNKRGKLKNKLGLPAGTNINTFIRELHEKLSRQEES